MGTPKTPDGKPVVSLWPTEGSRKTVISVNWCDPCTWYHKATRVVDESPTPNGTRTEWTLAHGNVIDTYHGRISGEDFITDSSGNSLRAVVKVDGVSKTEQDPHTGSGGDYTVNYSTGKITFLSAVAEGLAVTATYHYANGSEFVVAPSSGRVLKLASVEAQFSADIVVNDSIVFQPYGLASVFAPQLGLPEGTKIPLGNPTIYKTMVDYINEANCSHPTIPALGGNGWRGCGQPINIFDWDYQSVTDLYASKGMEIRVKLQHETPFGGLLATATFYSLSVEETT